MSHPHIDDLCANSDCGLSDEAHLSQFQSYADWEHAHKSCYWDEHSESARGGSLHQLFTFDAALDKWVRKA